jgi:hypothetical protein
MLGYANSSIASYLFGKMASLYAKAKFIVLSHIEVLFYHFDRKREVR